MSKSENRLLLDLDSLVYAAGFACQKSIYEVRFYSGSRLRTYDNLEDLKRDFIQWCADNGKTLAPRISVNVIEDSVHFFRKNIRVEPLSNCLHTVKIMLSKIKDDLGSQHTYGILSNKNKTYRHAVASDYKANRATVEKPRYFEEIRDYLVKHAKAFIVEDLVEADDLIGILAALLRDHGKPYVVVHIDKDLDQIPGMHYNWKKGTMYEVTEAQAKRMFWLQLVMGDPTDNIKGLPGFGVKRAEKLLSGINFNDPDAENEALRRIGFQYALAFDDPEEELMKTWQLVKILDKPLGTA